MVQRLISAAVVIPPFVLWLFYAPAWMFTLIVAVAAALAASEFLLTVQPERPRLALGIIVPASFAYIWSFSDPWRGASAAVLAATVSLLLTAQLLLGLRGRRSVEEAAAAGFAVLYVAGLLGYLVVLRAAPKGVELLFLLFACVWIGDTLALVVGKRWGRRPMAPSISPKKTIEGAVASLAASVVTAIAAQVTGIVGMSWGALLSLAVVIGLAGQLGDLLESLLKRSVGTKDTGGLIPGHGGLLDRIDGILLAAPVTYVWSSFVLKLFHR